MRPRPQWAACQATRAAAQPGADVGPGLVGRLAPAVGGRHHGQLAPRRAAVDLGDGLERLDRAHPAAQGGRDQTQCRGGLVDGGRAPAGASGGSVGARDPAPTRTGQSRTASATSSATTITGRSVGAARGGGPGGAAPGPTTTRRPSAASPTAASTRDAAES